MNLQVIPNVMDHVRFTLRNREELCIYYLRDCAGKY